MAASKPALLVCHGTYLRPVHYDKFLDQLHKQGFEAECPLYPTARVTDASPEDPENPAWDAPAPAGGWPTTNDDVRVVQAAVRRLVEQQGRDVVLVAHSYGGFVASQAAVPELQRRQRHANGLSGGVLGICYIAAVLCDEGQSIDGLYSSPGVYVPNIFAVGKHIKEGLVRPINGADFLFPDLPAAEAHAYAQAQTGFPVLQSPFTNVAAYRDLPTAYLISDNDRVVPPSFQETMIERVTGCGGSLTRYHCPAGHCPQLSWTEGTVRYVADFVASL